MITSLSSFIDNIKIIQENSFFRGQADCNWDLSPSIFRINNYSNDMEGGLFNLARRSAWKYLTYCKTELEQMVVLQHYGLKTRLLDLTSNPLIALYFACDTKENNNEKDGKVFVFMNTSTCNEVYAKIIAKFVSLKECNSKIRLKQKKCALDEFGCCDSVRSLANKISDPIFFHSPYNNDRIIAQKGAFIIFPFYFNQEIEKEKVNKLIMELYSVKEFIIGKDYKSQILNDLKLIGIDESTIFPDLEHQLKSLNEIYGN